MESPPQQTYTSESVWRDPRRFVATLRADLVRCPEVAIQLFVRELRASYRQSLLGYVWAFLPPLAWAAMFMLLRSQGVVSAEYSEIPYGAFVLTGMVFWQVFFDSLLMPSKVFVQAKPLLAKILFPREGLLLAGLFEVGFQFLLRVPFLIWALAQTAQPLHASLLLVPMGVLGLALLGMCIGVALLPFSLLYQDVGKSLALVGSFWLLLTPVAYQPPASGIGAMLASWNPVSPLLSVTRAWWLGQPSGLGAEFIVVMALTVVLLGAGWLVVRVALPHLVARMGA